MNVDEMQKTLDGVKGLHQEMKSWQQKLDVVKAECESVERRKSAMLAEVESKKQATLKEVMAREEKVKKEQAAMDAALAELSDVRARVAAGERALAKDR